MTTYRCGIVRDGKVLDGMYTKGHGAVTQELAKLCPVPPEQPGDVPVVLRETWEGNGYEDGHPQYQRIRSSCVICERLEA